MNDSTFPPITPQITVISANDLSPTARQEIIALCTAAYDEDFTEILALFPHATHVLARVEETLVSHACWVTRWFQPDGLPLLQTAYIEAVATAPAYQGKGIGSIVMRRVAEEIQPYELGGLSPAEEHIGFYKRLGWKMWEGPMAIRTSDGVMETPEEQIMVLPTARTPVLKTNVGITAEWREGELW